MGISLGAMKRKQLARELARTAHIPAAAAQDRVDEVVNEILRRLRAGEPVNLEELGDFNWGKSSLAKLMARPANGK